MKRLSNNAELSRYLRWLAKALKEREANELSENVAHASRVSRVMSTELLGESRIALRNLLKEGQGLLTDREREDVNDALIQIDGAFERKRYRA